MSFTLPHDLSEVKALQVSMLDDNFDTIQAWARDVEARLVGWAKQTDALIAKLEALEKAYAAHQGPTYEPPAKPKKKAKGRK